MKNVRIHNLNHGTRRVALANIAEQEAINEIRNYAQATEENQTEQARSEPVSVQFPARPVAFGVKIAIAL